jgi:hypothetical protein
MFHSSQDILFLTIAACVAAFTIFSCWGIFYIVGGLRNIFKISHDARRLLEKAEGILDALREKINSSASYLFIVGEALKKIMEAAKDFRSNKKSSGKSSKKSKEETEN